MADHSTCLPLTPDSIRQTHNRIKQYIHCTPVITSRTINIIASSPNPRAYLTDDPPSIWTDPEQSLPKFNLYFKCENHQKIGAFKARGAFSALTHLSQEIGIETLKKRGVVTHSSGNHAQALSLAAQTMGIKAWIVMPTISTKSKISGTKGYGSTIVHSGSTGAEREKVVKELIAREGGDEHGPILVPPYDHPDIMLGQGTAGMEMEEQYIAMKKGGKICSAAVEHVEGDERFDAVLAPVGGGGLLSGTATWYSHTHDGGKKTLVFGCEPNFEGANDIEQGLAAGKRIEHVKTLTIADGLRTPAGVVPWTVISDERKLEGVFSVSEHEIKMALKLMLERVKVVIEPSSAVPVAVILFNKKFRALVTELQKKDGKAWDVGVVISGGNTTVEALSKIFAEGWNDDAGEHERATGEVGLDGKRVAEDVAG